MVCRLMELFGDEWLLVAAYHWRWAYSTNENKGQFMYNGDRALNKNTADKEKTDYLEQSLYIAYIALVEYTTTLI